MISQKSVLWPNSSWCQYYIVVSFSPMPQTKKIYIFFTHESLLPQKVWPILLSYFLLYQSVKFPNKLNWLHFPECKQNWDEWMNEVNASHRAAHAICTFVSVHFLVPYASYLTTRMSFLSWYTMLQMRHICSELEEENRHTPHPFSS